MPCSRPCEVYSRVVGYYRPVQQWNPGKQAEFEGRREFVLAGPVGSTPHSYPPPHDPTPEEQALSAVPLGVLQEA